MSAVYKLMGQHGYPSGVYRCIQVTYMTPSADMQRLQSAACQSSRKAMLGGEQGPQILIGPIDLYCIELKLQTQHAATAGLVLASR
jgi:hypothetical protein